MAITRPWENDKVYLIGSNTEVQLGESVTAGVIARFLLPCRAKIRAIQYAFTATEAAAVADLDVLVSEASILSAAVNPGDGANAGDLTPADPDVVYPRGTNVTVVVTTGAGDAVDDVVMNLLFIPE